ncbi:OmpA family protein [Vibrio navarrensis]
MKKGLLVAMCALTTSTQAQMTLLEQVCETRALDQNLTVTAATPVVIEHHRHGYLLAQTQAQVDMSVLLGLLSSASHISSDCLAYLQQNQLLQVGTGDNATLARVYFEFDRSALSETSRQILESLAKKMQSNPHFLTLEGHTDSLGSDSYNLALGLRRSQAVAQYLHAEGVDEQAMQTTTKGASQPVAENASEQGRQKNRRVEIRL